MRISPAKTLARIPEHGIMISDKIPRLEHKDERFTGDQTDRLSVRHRRLMLVLVFGLWRLQVLGAKTIALRRR